MMKQGLSQSGQKSGLMFFNIHHLGSIRERHKPYYLKGRNTHTHTHPSSSQTSNGFRDNMMLGVCTKPGNGGNGAIRIKLALFEGGILIPDWNPHT